MATITSLFDLDRTVREASARLARGRRALASLAPEDEAPANPLAAFRRALGKDTFAELADVPDPMLAPALRAHVTRLTLARVLWDDEVQIARAWSLPSVTLDDNVKLPRLPSGAVLASGGTVSPKTLLAAVLVDTDDARRRQVAEAFARAARDHLRDPVRFHADRRARAAAQLGVSLDAVDLPVPSAIMEKAAAELLEATAPFAERFAPWDRGLARAAAQGATKGWPARLAPRWVLSIFEGTELVRGLSIEGVRLPAVLSGGSFARALVAFGEALGGAAAPGGAPFALARPALDLRPMRIGALLGMLVGDRAFARRALSLGPGAALDHGREFGRAGVASLRLLAAAARTRGALLPPRDDLDDRFREETARAWGEPLPPQLAGALPRIDEAMPGRFVATLLAALDRKRMIERLDEDWFRNPRSAEALRAIAAEPQPAVTEELLRAGVIELGRAVGEALS
jgi:hypothetical protein